MSKLLLATAAAFALLSIPAPAQDLGDGQLQAVAERAEQLADRFAKDFDDSLDKSILEGMPIEERLDRRAEKLRAALDEVHDKIGDGKDRKAHKEVESALSIGHDINLVMNQRRFSEKVEQQWSELRQDLNYLAARFDMRPLEFADGEAWRAIDAERQGRYRLGN